MKEIFEILNPESLTRLKKVEGIIWDLDNTLYRLDEALQEAFNLSIARAAISAGVPLRLGEAARMAWQSFLDHGYSGQVFIDQYGIDQRNLHFDFHGYLDETVIERSQETRSLFHQLGLKHVLVTHSARPWAEKVLSHLNLQDWFPARQILALEDYGFNYKHESKDSFEKALSCLGMDASRVLMVEDTMRNLEIPKEMGLLTCLVHHGSFPETIPDYVEMSSNSALGILQKLRDLRREAFNQKKPARV